MKAKLTQSHHSSFFIAAFFLLPLLGIQAQTTHSVNVTSNVFTPDVITISVGDEVTWTNSGGFHNVNGTTGTYPDNPESFGNSTGTGWTYSHTFNTPGVYDYQCDPHIGLGMVGQVIVEATSSVLTINFSGMNPHIGQMLKLFVRDQATGTTLDTVTVAAIEDAAFDLESHILDVGGSYHVDFYADMNGNGEYDAPPTDHAWRLVVSNAMGDVDLDFMHNTTFTDIMETGTTSYAPASADMALKVYPNPVTSLVTVESETIMRSAEILSVSGAVVRSYSGINSTMQTISLEELAAGVYLLRISSGNVTDTVVRIMKR